MMISISTCWACCLFSLPVASGFLPQPISTSSASRTVNSPLLFATGQGFGKSNGNSNNNNNSGNGIAKTYGKREIVRDVIDTETAMREFFSSTEEWHPLFRELATSSSVPAMTFLSDDQPEFDFDNTQTNNPWKRLQGIPSDEEDKKILATVLDCMHQSLVDIPVDELTNEDENDVQFLEEGRRMLAISRFHVLQGVHGGSVNSYDTLFQTCWSELMELRVRDEESSGSLIVVPDYDLSDLRRFTDINLLRPLEWLGVHTDFEVASMHRGSPAIRLLHKLQDMPNEPWDEPEEGEESIWGMSIRDWDLLQYRYCVIARGGQP